MLAEQWTVILVCFTTNSSVFMTQFKYLPLILSNLLLFCEFLSQCLLHNADSESSVHQARCVSPSRSQMQCRCRGEGPIKNIYLLWFRFEYIWWTQNIWFFMHYPQSASEFLPNSRIWRNLVVWLLRKCSILINILNINILFICCIN